MFKHSPDAIKTMASLGIDKNQLELLEKIAKTQGYDDLIEKINALLDYYTNARDYEIDPKPQEPCKFNISAEEMAMFAPRTTIPVEEAGITIRLADTPSVHSYHNLLSPDSKNKFLKGE